MEAVELLGNITVKNFTSCEYPILSVFEDKLLIGCAGCGICNNIVDILLILSPNGDKLTSISAVDNTGPIQDAMWTPRGNIMYLGRNGIRDIIVVLSVNAEVIAVYTQLKSTPGPFCLSNDGIIYVAEIEVGVHQSADDGVSWNVGFNPVDGWYCAYFLKVVLDNYEYFWTYEHLDDMRGRYRMYTVNRKQPDSNVIFKDINITTIEGKQTCIGGNCRLSFDGNMNILLSDNNKTVFAWSLNGEHHFQLLPPDLMNDKPYILAVNKDRQLLYAGESYGIIKVFQLKYETKSLMII